MKRMPATFLLALLLASPPLAAAVWTPTGDSPLVPEPWASPVTVALGDGRVLSVQHGSGAAAMWSPVTGSWTSTGSLAIPRVGFTLTAVGPRHAIAVGGRTDWDDDVPRVAEIERYDADTGTWTSIGSLITPRDVHQAVRLVDGRVLVTGGLRADENGTGEGLGPRTLNSVEIIDGMSGAVSASAPMGQGRFGFALTVLRSGAVLAVGGYAGASGSLQSSGEVWSPATGAWTMLANELPEPIVDFALAPLGNGGALIIEGSIPYSGALGPNMTVAYDPALNRFVSAPPPVVRRAGATASVLADGRILVAGGMDPENPSETTATAEMFYPWLNAWLPTAAMIDERTHHAAVRVPRGRVLVVGGTAGPKCEVFRPGFWLLDLLRDILRPRPAPFAPIAPG